MECTVVPGLHHVVALTLLPDFRQADIVPAFY
jgi:hypothetical protein